MDSVVHGVAKSQTGLRKFHFHFLFLKYIIYLCKSEVRPSIFISNMLSGDVESMNYILNNKDLCKLAVKVKN